MTSTTNHNTSIVPRSGIIKNMKKKTHVTNKKAINHFILSNNFFFFNNHHAKNITKHILKNSAGCIVHNQLIYNHQVDQLNVIHNGENTNNKKINQTINILFLCSCI
jgi:hypothetical protein